MIQEAWLCIECASVSTINNSPVLNLYLAKFESEESVEFIMWKYPDLDITFMEYYNERKKRCNFFHCKCGANCIELEKLPLYKSESYKKEVELLPLKNDNVVAFFKKNEEVFSRETKKGSPRYHYKKPLLFPPPIIENKGDACDILKQHNELLKDDPEHLSTEFIKSLIKMKSDPCPEIN